MVANRKRRAPWIIGAACVLVAGIVATALLVPRTAASADRQTSPIDVATADVTRGDLVENMRVKGTLGFAGAAEMGTGLAGTITAVSPVGAVVDRGGELYRVDDRPVLLLIGGLPMWRDFALGMDDGPDVLQLEQNLAELGYFTREPDNEFAESTEGAIEKWQEALGLEETGRIELGRVEFSPGAVRIATHTATVGDAASPAIVTASGTEKRVTAFIAPNLKEVATVGATVSVTLPDGSKLDGTVQEVGAPVEKDDGMGGKAMRLPIVVTLNDPALAEAYTDVSVNIALSLVKSVDALRVPVLALLAQPGGGFAVEKVSKSNSTIVPVELGVFADGLVEILDGAIAEGDAVVVGE
jgi:peptidoglycan hydrolase-like protein with peptidoglycan-binding domain